MNQQLPRYLSNKHSAKLSLSSWLKGERLQHLRLMSEKRRGLRRDLVERGARWCRWRPPPCCRVCFLLVNWHSSLYHRPQEERGIYTGLCRKRVFERGPGCSLITTTQYQPLKKSSGTGQWFRTKECMRHFNLHTRSKESEVCGN